MALLYPLDSASLRKNRIKLKKAYLDALNASGKAVTSKKIAFLCGSTADAVRDMCELFLLDNGIKPEFWLSGYDRYWQDGVFGNPELDAFAPDTVYIHTTARNIEKYFPDISDTEETAAAKLDEAKKSFELLWQKLAARYNCPIIQNNFEYPRYRLMGNRDAADFRGATAFVSKMNAFTAEYAAANHPNFHINDVSYISACYGLDRWSDQSVWYMYKYAMAIDAIPDFAFNLSNIIKSLFGKNKKAIALDLDNTLWGGVVGDDGVDNLSLGEETAEAQAYLDFQKYIGKVKGLGVMLTVNSKNDIENAIAGLKHRDSALKPEDFLIIKANWEPKNVNLTEIAAELNIGVDSIVFVDDNPAERHIVASTLPVSAPDIDSPENYIRVLDRNGFFEVTSFSDEDLKRNEMYRANAARKAERVSFGSYEDYLRSLEMTAEIGGFIPEYIQRIAQLTNKSNQFNVTTRRYTAAEIEETAADSGYITLYGKLADRFGDNGVVSVVIGHKNGKTLDIDLWIMSCRVLKRDMEYAMLDSLVSRALDENITEIRGYYIPTAKNGMVRGLFADFGFAPVSESDDGSTVWTLETASYKPKNRYIGVKQNERKE